MLLPWNLKTNYLRGKWSEFVARSYLRLHGYHILARNYVKGRGVYAGELDIVACKKHTVVFVEVKQRRKMERAFYAISPKQRQRITYGAQNFIKFNPQYMGYDVRFDAVFICLPLSVIHIRNAWQISPDYKPE